MQNFISSMLLALPIVTTNILNALLSCVSTCLWNIYHRNEVHVCWNVLWSNRNQYQNNAVILQNDPGTSIYPSFYFYFLQRSSDYFWRSMTTCVYKLCSIAIHLRLFFTSVGIFKKKIFFLAIFKLFWEMSVS